jgi:hypothetical protein
MLFMSIIEFEVENPEIFCPFDFRVKSFVLASNSELISSKI